jgi:hypothetical protein
VQGFCGKPSKTLHISKEHFDAPLKIYIDYMSEFHKNGFKEPFLRNYAALPHE